MLEEVDDSLSQCNNIPDIAQQNSTRRGIAVVLGAGGNGYDAVKSLCGHGVRTYLLNASLPRDGKYPGAELLICPDPDLSDELCGFLDRSIPQSEPVVLIPCGDAYVTFLSNHGDRLHNRFRYLQSSFETIRDVNDKFRFFQRCRNHQIPVPATVLFRGTNEVEAGADSLPYPCIVKPTRSRGWGMAAGYGVRRFDSPVKLREFARRMDNSQVDFLMQEEIPGGPESIYFVGGLYDENARPEKVFVGRKLLQYPPGVGSTCCACLTDHEEVLSLANRLADVFRLSGLVDIEFMLDSRDATFKAIEVNPRNGLWHRISHDGTWDITTYYYARLMGHDLPKEEFKPHEVGRRWIFPDRYLCSAVEVNGLIRGVRAWRRAMRSTPLRCSWDVRDLRRLLRSTRMIVGHLRRLPLRTLCCGGMDRELCRNSNEANKM